MITYWLNKKVIQQLVVFFGYVVYDAHRGFGPEDCGLTPNVTAYPNVSDDYIFSCEKGGWVRLPYLQL